MQILARPALALVNHILKSEDWARNRLKGFAGKTAQLQFAGRGVGTVTIGDEGLLEASPIDAAAAVTIDLPADAPARMFTDPASLFSTAMIAGSAELAETLGFVFRNLRWDVEHDLSHLLGDIVAHRAVQFGTRLAQWPGQAGGRVALALAEYLTEETATIACRSDVETFCAEVDALRDDVARAEKRLARLAPG